MEAIKLLPLCISVVVPLCYISETATTATQQDEGISIVSEPCHTAPESEPHGLLVAGPSGVPTPPLVMSPLPVSSLPDIPSGWYSLVTTFFCWPIYSSTGKVRTTLPVTHSTIFMLKRTCMLPPQKSRLGVNIAPHGVMNHTPNPTTETRTDSWQTVMIVPQPFLQCHQRASWSQWWCDGRHFQEHWRPCVLRLWFIQRKLSGLWPGHCLSCWDTDKISMKTAHKKYRKRVRASCKLGKGMDWIWCSNEENWGWSSRCVGPQSWDC